MSLYYVVFNVFAGLLLAAHYKTDKLTTVLGTVVCWWPNAWAFLLLRKRGHGVWKSLGLILLAYVALFCLAVTTAVVLSMLDPRPPVVF